MLIGIDPLLGGELLKLLDEMGHGDRFAVVDRNYPAASSGRPVLRLGDVTVTRAIKAVLGVFPLDEFVDNPIERMEGDSDAQTEVQGEVLALARQVLGSDLDYAVISRLDFYERAKSVRFILHTLDPRPYGCFIVQKGVVDPGNTA
jgi:L-fucose mutarotase